MQKKIYLTRGTDDSTVEAAIVKLATKHVEDFENQWVGLLTQYKQEDKLWDLMVKLRMTSRYNNYEGYAVESENQTEGLLVTETTMHGSQMARGESTWRCRFPSRQSGEPEGKTLSLLLLEAIDGSNCHAMLPQGHCHGILPNTQKSIKAWKTVNIIHEVLNKTCCVIYNV